MESNHSVTNPTVITKTNNDNIHPTQLPTPTQHAAFCSRHVGWQGIGPNGGNPTEAIAEDHQPWGEGLKVVVPRETGGKKQGASVDLCFFLKGACSDMNFALKKWNLTHTNRYLSSITTGDTHLKNKKMSLEMRNYLFI